VVHWIYMAVIRPMLTYAAVIWWPRARYITVSKQLTCYNSYISTTIGVPVYYRSHENNSYSSYETAGRSGSATYTFIQQEAIMAYYRLRAASQWVDGRGEHAKISQKMAQLMPLSQARCDRRVPKYYFDKYSLFRSHRGNSG